MCSGCTYTEVTMENATDGGEAGERRVIVQFIKAVETGGEGGVRIHCYH